MQTEIPVFRIGKGFVLIDVAAPGPDGAFTAGVSAIVVNIVAFSGGEIKIDIGGIDVTERRAVLNETFAVGFPFAPYIPETVVSGNALFDKAVGNGTAVETDPGFA